MWAMASQYPQGRFGEIGMGAGRSTLALCAAAKAVGGVTYSIDKAPCWGARKQVHQHGYWRYHRFVRGDSHAVSFPEQLDVLFIDGDHSYGGVAGDYWRHRSSVKDGGLIFFHDPISWYEGVGRFLEDNNIFYIPLGGAGLGILPI